MACATLVLSSVLGLMAGTVLAGAPVDVYKSPYCGCCGKWAEHMQKNGFKVVTHEVDNVPAKRKSLGAIIKEVLTNEASVLVDSDAANKAGEADAALQDLGADVAGYCYVTTAITVLGETGVNFAAGMTGGFAYVLDECGSFAKRTNPELVELLEVADLAIHQEHLRGIITAHLNETGSSRAEEILANFDSYVPKFRLIKPKSSDVKSLLGHTSRSSAELRIQAQ